MTDPLTPLRERISSYNLADEDTLTDELIATADLPQPERDAISDRAATYVRAVRDSSDPSMMESFLAEYGLSTQEGVALMCLAEALLRVPDNATIDDLIRDKVMPHDWGAHVGDSGSILVNASTWALMLTGKVLADEEPGVVGALRGMVRRMGEPVVRLAVRRAMQEMGEQFVLGETIESATRRGSAMVERGYTYSYDMLGEAARTFDDAERYFEAYRQAIAALAARAQHDDIARNPGISVKLSALHPRYEQTHHAHTLVPLSEKVLALAEEARKAQLGFNIDAEEANRLEFSLDIVERVFSSPTLAGWDGFGVVVQAYGRRALPVIDWLYTLADSLDRRLMVRLVKGAYWDTEIKLAQVLGLDGYPVLTRKINTDVSYIACARRLLSRRDRFYPQFATHNAHTMAAVLAMADGRTDDFEFQRLHGMGEALHEAVRRDANVRSRIYAPVGAHEDLLAYLVRRLLENGANSSFVNQIVDESISPETIAADPFAEMASRSSQVNRDIPPPSQLYGPMRQNSAGFDPQDAATLATIATARAPFLAPYVWDFADDTNAQTIHNPSKTDDIVGRITLTPIASVADVVERARRANAAWSTTSISTRAAYLRKAADAFEAAYGELFALLAREAGKTIADAIAELREAVDFLRYYAAEAERSGLPGEPRGTIICISPWNFPLAIFTGQIAAALVTGNTVVAKPAEQSPLIAARAVALLHAAGIPADVLQLVIGDGELGGALTANADIAGVCFTGSTAVARVIERSLAANNDADTMLIAETGGLNAMLVDSTALNEQAVRDIVASAFQSAGQRCSALRLLYVQKERAESLLAMLAGAMDALQLGDPLDTATDVGPLIDAQAHAEIRAYCDDQTRAGRMLKQLPSGESNGYQLGPALIKTDGIESIEREVFGPVLHVAEFDADDVDSIIAAVNERGYGLTFGLHTRIDERVQRVVNRVHVGNVYVNRNQIGAIVGSQPFGGEGLSGTGPKAGGPHYLMRFRTSGFGNAGVSDAAPAAHYDAAALDAAFRHPASAAWSARSDRHERLRGLGADDTTLRLTAALPFAAVDLPGPTGESNRLSVVPVGRVICLNSAANDLRQHVIQALACGNTVVAVAPDAAEVLADLVRPDIPLCALSGALSDGALREVRIDVVASAAPNAERAAIRQVLSERDGAIVRLIDEVIAPTRFIHERAVCIDTTAAGGNAELLAQNS
ncbi:MAG: bifunctional proline dehydrogenase/L-glutamate gamma-semialdehyde dehydrogenase PutA [Pseudomonadota bacterium]